MGKSELARQLARAMYRDRNALLTLDMAEYAEPGSINKLIGAPPGFMGAEKEGGLISWLQNHPTSGVLLFDEIEKAGRDIKNLLLGLLDNGRIASAQGKRMDCRHCVVIMTSNAISKESLTRTLIGFGGAQKTVNPAELLTNSFPNEFLERLDDIILFNALGKDDILKIIRLRLDEASERLRKRSIHLCADMERLTRYLAKRLNPSSGARGIERIVEQTVIDPIALTFVKLEDIKEADVFIGDEFYENGSVEFRPKKQ